MGQGILGGYEKILLCTDGSAFSEGAVREGIGLAKICGAGLTVINVVDFNPEFESMAPNLVEKMETEAAACLKTVKDRAEAEGISCRAFVVRSEIPYSEIVSEAADMKADLIVMGRRGKTGVARFLMGSVTKRVIGHAPCNVLVVPKDAKIEGRTVLAATDGSICGMAAVEEAVKIAGRCGSGLVFVSVAPSEEISPFDIVRSDMQKEMISDSETKAAEKNVRDAKTIADQAGVRAAGIVMGGSPYDAIVRTAGEKNADLIVVGSHGRTGLDRLLMGSVAERIVGHAACAVLVVKRK